MSASRRRVVVRIAGFIGIGLVAGVLSGLFGVGGGTIVVPLLVAVAAFSQRLASGTSSAAIIPIAAVGAVSYALAGHVDYLAAGLLAAGAVVGAQIGVRLLHRLRESVLRWIFVGFLLVVVVSLFIVIPAREADIEITGWSGAALVLTGLITGTASGLIGVGGGIIVVPAMILVFGASDLVAKGTSLLMMIPTSLSGTIGNIRRRNVDLVAGLSVGLAACATAPLGVLLAAALDPRVANILFAGFLVAIAVQLAVRAVRGWRARRGAE